MKSKHFSFDQAVIISCLSLILSCANSTSAQDSGKPVAIAKKIGAVEEKPDDVEAPKRDDQRPVAVAKKASKPKLEADSNNAEPTPEPVQPVSLREALTRTTQRENAKPGEVWLPKMVFSGARMDITAVAGRSDLEKPAPVLSDPPPTREWPEEKPEEAEKIAEAAIPMLEQPAALPASSPQQVVTTERIPPASVVVPDGAGEVSENGSFTSWDEVPYQRVDVAKQWMAKLGMIDQSDTFISAEEKAANDAEIRSKVLSDRPDLMKKSEPEVNSEEKTIGNSTVAAAEKLESPAPKPMAVVKRVTKPRESASENPAPTEEKLEAKPVAMATAKPIRDSKKADAPKKSESKKKDDDDSNSGATETGGGSEEKSEKKSSKFLKQIFGARAARKEAEAESAAETESEEEGE